MSRRRVTSPTLDRGDAPTHDPPMPSDRVAKVLKLAAELDTEERAELAEELWGTVPDEVAPEWTDEIQLRLKEMREAEARGQPVGQRLTFDELLREIKAGSGG